MENLPTDKGFHDPETLPRSRLLNYYQATPERALQAVMPDHLGYEMHARSDNKAGNPLKGSYQKKPRIGISTSLYRPRDEVWPIVKRPIHLEQFEGKWNARHPTMVSLGGTTGNGSRRCFPALFTGRVYHLLMIGNTGGIS